ncbi:hypothetical protein GCM10009738_69230 [Kitasatospora viridis]
MAPEGVDGDSVVVRARGVLAAAGGAVRRTVLMCSTVGFRQPGHITPKAATVGTEVVLGTYPSPTRDGGATPSGAPGRGKTGWPAKRGRV